MSDHAAFRASLRGEVFEPADAGYHEARKLYNAMIDKKPALIVRCADVADVITSVNYARQHGILLAIRGGGHNGPGLGGCNDGLVIDLSRMRGVRVNPGARTAQVAGGAVWGDVDHATHPFTTTFQSPSHRGGSAPGSEIDGRTAEDYCFNPLLIGAGALPGQQALGSAGEVVFQSPSHRGGSAPSEIMVATHNGCPCFNPLLIGAGALPSAPPHGGANGRGCFNPLLIGAGALPRRLLDLGAQLARAFQSPSHRGGSAPCWQGLPQLEGSLLCFNPLLIGAGALPELSKNCPKEPEQ